MATVKLRRFVVYSINAALFQSVKALLEEVSKSLAVSLGGSFFTTSRKTSRFDAYLTRHLQAQPVLERHFGHPFLHQPFPYHRMRSPPHAPRAMAFRELGSEGSLGTGMRCEPCRQTDGRALPLSAFLTQLHREGCVLLSPATA